MNDEAHSAQPQLQPQPQPQPQPRPRQPPAPPRRQSTYHYQTFPTAPPKSAGSGYSSSPRSRWLHAPATASFRPTSPSTSSARSPASSTRSLRSDDSGSDSSDSHATPLPTRQLILLALLALLEQTALNSLAPYLPSMVASFPDVPPESTGLYVGVLGSVFALAQLATNLGWGYLSDIHGRKPVLLVGMVLLGVCFGAFGFCTRYWHAVLAHAIMGLVNGNAAVVPAVYGELTDRSNQTTAFKWLPVLYTVGAITGPALGGFLVGLKTAALENHPYLLPNLISAILLGIGVVVLGVWFEETRPADEIIPWQRPACVIKLADWWRRWRLERSRNRRRRQSWSARWPRRDGGREGRPLIRDGHSDSASIQSDGEAEAGGRPALDASSRKNSVSSRLSTGSKWAAVAAKGGFLGRLYDLSTPATAILLGTVLLFHLSLVSFNSLYPTFAATPPPTGRGLSPGLIGGLLSASGVATVVFQLFLYELLKRHMGNLGSYRASLLGFAVSMALMPWVGRLDDRPRWGLGSSEGWLWLEIGAVLVIKNMAAVAGLASVMLLVTNSAPSTDSLGTLNGIAYTLAAAGRSIGPFFSGGLFTLSQGIHPKGEVLAWSVFSGIALIGWLATYAIRGAGLESDDYQEEAEDDDGDGQGGQVS